MSPTDAGSAPGPVAGHPSALGRYVRALAAPVVLWALLAVTLSGPLRAWLRGENSYDRDVLQEWLEEARGFRETLPEMIDSYLARAAHYEELSDQPAPAGADGDHLLQLTQARVALSVKRAEIQEYLQDLGVPPTKEYPGQLPLFPVIFRLEVRLQLQLDNKPVPPIIWDSELPSESAPYQELVYRLHPRAEVFVRYQLHAYNKRQRLEQDYQRRVQQLAGLAAAATVLGLTWVVVVQRREHERERQRLLARQQVDEAQRRGAEAERQLLEQRLATQAAEQKTLELRSQLYASIGIMAGSYAHNIKNLLVRPNDLLRRCQASEGLSAEQQAMLHEVQQTLGTVTERLQQILRTIRRDPTRADAGVLDLNAVLAELEKTWRELAYDKWKLELVTELQAGPRGPEPLWVAADLSHLQQAIENLLFNARDATFEMRNHLRDTARRDAGLDAAARRQALIGAAAWRGRVVLRTYRAGGEVVLEVRDNGAGMSEEVRRRCTETHFSTKRDNAIYEGHNTGMGLGLSFVVAILEHHHARLEIESEPLRGTTFRIRFPAAGADHRRGAAAAFTPGKGEG
jgi:signal transduction histidine kinase